MAARSRKNPLFTNPFFATLVVVSVLFVVTTLGYLVAPAAINPRPVAQGETSRALAHWLDHYGPLILGIEFAIMLAMGVLAMLTDDHFSAGPDSSSPRESPREDATRTER